MGRNIQSSGYASVLVSLREVKQHLHGGASLKGLTQRDICDRFGIADRAVAALMETGILSTVVEKHPIHMCPVTVVPEAVATDFFARYATLFQITRETGQHHIKLNRLLRHRQCKPAFDPTKLGLTIYNREEVSLALGPS